MGSRDQTFVCPDCFGKVFQVFDEERNGYVYYCIPCGNGPLAICGECLRLALEEQLIDFECPSCLEQEIITEVRVRLFTGKSFN